MKSIIHELRMLIAWILLRWALAIMPTSEDKIKLAITLRKMIVNDLHTRNTMEKQDRIWKDLERYIKTIRDEIRTESPDAVTIDFYLFKIERRVQILKEYLNDTSRKSLYEAL